MAVETTVESTTEAVTDAAATAESSATDAATDAVAAGEFSKSQKSGLLVWLVLMYAAAPCRSIPCNVDFVVKFERLFRRSLCPRVHAVPPK